MQSTGHGNILHASVFVKGGHVKPPYRGSCVMVREKDCIPPPHEAEHEEV
jgi:hypothetical protein